MVHACTMHGPCESLHGSCMVMNGVAELHVEMREIYVRVLFSCKKFEKKQQFTKLPKAHLNREFSGRKRGGYSRKFIQRRKLTQLEMNPLCEDLGISHRANRSLP